MIYLELLWSFIKIGFTSFGGLSTIPLISSEMLSHGWMTTEEISDIVAIAEMTPGPLGFNCATFAGMRAAGLLGAAAANLGVMMPTLTLCLVAAVFFQKFRTSTFTESVLTGVRPVCLALIAGILISLAQTNFIVNGSVSIWAILIGVADYFSLKRLKLNISVVILMSAAAGILLMGPFH